MELAVQGLIAGVLATLVMTLSEIPSWKKWGLKGVFEWHENQSITAYLTHNYSISYPGIFGLHFLNGTLGGIVFPYVEYYVAQFIPPIVSGILYGILLWTLTLFPIHKPITGLHPWNHPLGKMPAIASLVGHIFYGLVLGAVVWVL